MKNDVVLQFYFLIFIKSIFYIGSYKEKNVITDFWFSYMATKITNDRLCMQFSSVVKK